MDRKMTYVQEVFGLELYLGLLNSLNNNIGDVTKMGPVVFNILPKNPSI
jgi:hypothetical protein